MKTFSITIEFDEKSLKVSFMFTRKYYIFCDLFILYHKSILELIMEFNIIYSSLCFYIFITHCKYINTIINFIILTKNKQIIDCMIE